MATETSRIELLIDTVQTGKNMQEVTRAAKALQKELAGVGVDEATIAKGSTALAGLKDRLDKVKQTTAGLDPDAKLQRYQALGSGIVGTFGIATGALGLFGTKNEELNKIIERTNAVMAILAGITSAQQVKEQQEIIKTLALKEANVVATEAQVGATTQLTVAQKALNVVMDANPIFLLLTIAGSIFAFYKLWGDNAELTKEKQDALNKSIENSQKLLTSEKAIIDEKLKTAELELENLKLRDKANSDYYTNIEEKEKEVLKLKLESQNKDIESSTKTAIRKAQLANTLLDEDIKRTKQEIENLDLLVRAGNETAKKNVKELADKQRLLEETKKANNEEIKANYIKLNTIKNDSKNNQLALTNLELTQRKARNERIAAEEAKAEAKRKEAAKKAQDEFKALYDKYQNDIKVLRELYVKAEIDGVEDKYDQQKYILAKGLADDIVRVNETIANEEQKNIVIEELKKTFNSKINAIDKQRTTDEAAEETKRLEAAKTAAENFKQLWDDYQKSIKEKRIKDLQDYISLASQSIQALGSIFDAIATIEQQKLQANELRTKQYYDRLEYLENKRYASSSNALNSKYQSEFNAAKGNATKQQQITDAYNEAVRQSTYERDKAIAELEYQRQLREYANAEERNRIAEKEFKRNKAYQLANAVIQTAAGVTGALAQTGIEGPLAIAQSIAIGIAGAAQIAKIASTKFSPTDIGQPPIAPIVEPNIPSTSTASSEFNNGTPTPAQFNTEFITTGKLKGNEFVKVYVLESDITNVQRSVKAQVQNNTFG